MPYCSTDGGRDGGVRGSMWRSLARYERLAVLIQDDRLGDYRAADAGEVADLHPHREVSFVEAVAGGAGGAEELHMRRVLLTRLLKAGRAVQGQARYT